MAARRLIKRIVLAATVVVCLGSLAFVLAPVADAGKHHKPNPLPKGTKFYRLIWQGSQGETYSAQDSNAIDGHYPTCEYTNTGSTTVHWKDVWKLPIVVERNRTRILTGRAEYVGGPATEHLGTSNITGDFINPPSGHCGLVGHYNCNSRITPTGNNLQLEWKDLSGVLAQVHLPPFNALKGDYTGQAPKGLPCSTIGSNIAPGSFAYATFSVIADLGTALISDDDIRGITKDKPYEVTSDDDPTMLRGPLPRQESSCSDGTDQGFTCTWTSVNRSAKLTLERFTK